MQHTNLLSAIIKPIFEVNSLHSRSFHDLPVYSFVNSPSFLSSPSSRNSILEFKYELPPKYGESKGSSKGNPDQLIPERMSDTGYHNSYSYSKMEIEIGHVIGFIHTSYMSSSLRSGIVSSLFPPQSPFSPDKSPTSFRPTSNIQSFNAKKGEEAVPKPNSASNRRSVASARGHGDKKSINGIEGMEDLKSLHEMEEDLEDPFQHKKENYVEINKDLIGLDVSKKSSCTNVNKMKTPSKEREADNKVLEQTFKKLGITYDVGGPATPGKRTSDILPSIKTQKDKAIQQILNMLPNYSFLLDKSLSIPRDIFEIKS